MIASHQIVVIELDRKREKWYEYVSNMLQLWPATKICPLETHQSGQYLVKLRGRAVLLFRLVHFLPHSVVSGMGLVPAMSDATV